jgi:hypothetical protein
MPVVLRANVRMAACALILACGLPAAAQVPAALDLAPPGAAGIGGVNNIGAFVTKLQKNAEFLPPDLTGGLVMIQAVLGMPGVNREGSLGIVQVGTKAPEKPEAAEGEDAMLDEPARPEPIIVLIAPVTDFKAFTTAANAQDAGSVMSISMPGSPAMFLKDLGNGYAALSDDKDAVTKFKGEKGAKPAIEKMIGPVGNRVSAQSDLVLIGDMQQMKADMQKGIDTLKQDAQMGMMMMPIGGGADLLGPLEAIVKNFLRDASVGIIGLNLGETGVSIDIASQFTPESELAGFFQSEGKSAALTNKLPNQPFLLSFAADTSSPGMKKIFSNLEASMNAEAAKAAAAKKDEKPAAQTFDAMKMILDAAKKSDGVAFQLGFTPAPLQTGLLSSSVLYAETKDAAAQAGAMKSLVSSMNGTQIEGTKYSSTWEAAKAEASGIKADAWSISTEPDPDAPPEDFMMSTMRMALYGSPPSSTGGPRGLIATTDSAVFMTLSQNSKLLASAIDAAKASSGMGTEALTKSVADQLPANRTFEMYVGAKPILDTVSGLARMFGQPLNFTLPDKLEPVGLGATTDNGGVQIRLHVPHNVIRAARNVMQNMEGQGGERRRGPQT